MTWDEITIVLRTHPSRSAEHGPLVASLAVATAGAPIIIVPHPPDAAPSANAVRWLPIGALLGRPWVLHVEDDIKLGPHFNQIPDILAIRPGQAAVCSFFALADGPDGWVTCPASRWYSTCCVVVDASLAVGYENYASNWYLEHPKHRDAADLLLGSWCASQRRRIAVWRPSLVQHQHLPSVLNARSKHRQSASYRRVHE